MKREKLDQVKIQNYIIQLIKKELRLKKGTVDINRYFLDYGFASLQAVGLSGELAKWMGKEISPTIFLEYENIKKLSEYLAGGYPPSKVVKRKLIKKPKEMSIKKEERTKLTDFNQFAEIYSLEKYKNEVEKIAGMALYFRVNDKIAANLTYIEGKEYINFSSYNYIDMSGDKEVEKCAIEAIKRYGTSVSGSRLVGGEKPLHVELEKEISHFLGTEDCIVFNSGHATNVTTIGHMMKKNDLILLDKLSHNSIVQGALLSGATIKFFQHNDVDSLENILIDSRADYDRVLIVTEGVFSMDGDISPIPEIIKIKKKYHALLYIDEAHSLGVLGKSGRGIGEYFNISSREVDFWMGTLSKALGSSGGYIAGKKALIEYLKYSAPGFVYSCGLSPPDVAAALAAIRKLKADPSRVTILQNRANYFLSLLKKAKINTSMSADTPVIPIIVGDSEKTIKLCAALRRHRLYFQALFYPAVEVGASRLRAFINASHTKKQLRFAADTIIHEMKRLRLL